MLKIDKIIYFNIYKMSSKDSNIAITQVLQQQTPDNDNKSTLQTYDVTKEENSKVRYLMSYYGY